jgi:PHP family Zn ribbon phosphoesterase
VLLTLDEYETIRLADLEGLYQDQAASLMNVSRQTFGRIIEAARRKVADVLVNGKGLKIEGGPVSMKAKKPAMCPRCRQAFSPDCDKRNEMSCPHCGEHA